MSIRFNMQISSFAQVFFTTLENQSGVLHCHTGLDHNLFYFFSMTWKPHIRQTNYQMNVCFVKHQCGVGEMIISNQTRTTTKSSLDEGERRIPYFSPVVPIKTI